MRNSTFSKPTRASAVALLLVGFLVLGCNRGGFPEKLAPAREAFDQSVLAFWQADNMFNPKPGESMVFRSPSQEKVMFQKIQKGIELSDKVTDDFLDYAHPELKEMYRNKLIPGKQMYLEGALRGDRIRQLQGSKLVVQWGDFWKDHQKEITDRIHPEGKTSSLDPAGRKIRLAGFPFRYT
jgi:hypothetical protein